MNPDSDADSVVRIFSPFLFEPPALANATYPGLKLTPGTRRPGICGRRITTGLDEPTKRFGRRVSAIPRTCVAADSRIALRRCDIIVDQTCGPRYSRRVVVINRVADFTSSVLEFDFATAAFSASIAQERIAT